MKSEPENSLETLLSLVVFQNRTSTLSWRKLCRSHWSQFSLLKLSLSFSTKRKQSILLNSPFLSVSSIMVKQYPFNLAMWKNSLWEVVCIHEKKLSCINYSVNNMTSSTRNLARAPSRWVGSTAGALRHPRLETELNNTLQSASSKAFSYTPECIIT